MKTTEAVEKVLREDIKSRETGSFNTWLYLIKVVRKLGINLYINYEELKEAPSPESILKIRRDILHKQNRFQDDHPHYEEGVTYHKKASEDGLKQA